MRVCVVGCGALGGIFAAHLARLEGVETFAYDVDAAHVAAINEAGLRLTGVANLCARLTASTRPDDLPPSSRSGMAVVVGPDRYLDTDTTGPVRAGAGAGSRR
mgnify:CR=1 FL=1